MYSINKLKPVFASVIPVYHLIITLVCVYVTGFSKNVQIIHLVFQFEYLNHCGSLMLDCSHAGFTTVVFY